MPGIYGFISKKKYANEHKFITLPTMTSMLNHQYWYNLNEYEGEDYGFGAININSEPSSWHTRYKGESYIVLLDGYVYSVGKYENDTNENIASKLIKVTSGENPDFNSIQGNYTIAIYNIDRKKFLLFNDRIGPRRIYFADLPNIFIFAPEVKAISFLSYFEKIIDWKGVADFLNYGYILGENTFFRNIKSLPSASYVKFDQYEKDLEINKYWMPVYQESNRSFDQSVDLGLSLLKHSIHEKVKQAHSIICPISGGLDSRIILANLNSLKSPKLVIPITYGQKFSYEYKNALKVCKSLGYKNHNFVDINPEALLENYLKAVWLSEGMIPMTNCHLLLLPEKLGNGKKCLLNGIYGGPTNYGAEYYKESHINTKLNNEEKTKDIQKIISSNIILYKNILPELNFDKLSTFSFSSIYNELEKYIDVSDKFCNQRDAFFIENRMRRLICQSSLYKFYWEEQLPLSNYELYQFYLSTPPNMKLHRKLLKEMLKKGFPDLARITDSNTDLNLYQKQTTLYKFKRKTKFLCRYYTNRLSKGFFFFYNTSTYAHYDIWFQQNKNTNNFFKKHLFSSLLNEDSIFNINDLRNFFNTVNSTRNGFDQLNRLTTFAIWYRLFVKELGVTELQKDIAAFPLNFHQ
jgi:asparagine synthase (glutamine-hydrolysing)